MGGEAIALAAIEDLKKDGVQVREDMDESILIESGRLKSVYRIPLADTICIALAYKLSATVLTTDYQDFENMLQALKCPVSFIRPKPAIEPQPRRHKVNIWINHDLTGPMLEDLKYIQQNIGPDLPIRALANLLLDILSPLYQAEEESRHNVKMMLRDAMVVSTSRLVSAETDGLPEADILRRITSFLEEMNLMTSEEAAVRTQELDVLMARLNEFQTPD